MQTSCHSPTQCPECLLHPCSGKSTVGKLVASALKYPYLDSDTLIEQLAGCTISDIFREEGEESFREVESQVLQVGLPYGCSLLTSHTTLIQDASRTIQSTLF